jgi:TM2 domain-containing membrane protein YozV
MDQTLCMNKEVFPPNDHTILAGYIFWIFGFTGAHRFYYGKKWTGLLWFCSFGMFGIGWLVDAFLIPSMDEEAETRYVSGSYNYNIAWLLITFFGFLGFHRFYLGRIWTGVLWLCTGGLLTFGWAWDLWHMNEMVSEQNSGK